MAVIISIHAPLAGRDPGIGSAVAAGIDFNPRAPCGARRQVCVRHLGGYRISIHAPLAGRDAPLRRSSGYGTNFNPRAPCGARQHLGRHNHRQCPISIHAPLAGRDGVGFNQKLVVYISIHAPLAGRDRRDHPDCHGAPGFQSTRPLRGATFSGGVYTNQSAFQSTRPLRGATPSGLIRPPEDIYFNPRAPCGARLCFSVDDGADGNFNPRAPCGARQQKCTNCFAHFCDNRQVLSKFAQNAACQGILIPFPFRKSLQIWVRTARAISARLRFAL